MIINRFSFLTKLTILISILIFINSCGMLRSADSRKIPVNAKERVKKNIEEGRGIRLFNKDDKGGTFQFASANPLWRASLETLDFIPLTNASYSGGIIITDWYGETNTSNENESIKISIKFLSNEIRSDAINIQIYKKNCAAFENCAVMESKSKLNEELKIAILKKASQLDNASKVKKN
jgi:hypothetical protein